VIEVSNSAYPTIELPSQQQFDLFIREGLENLEIAGFECNGNGTG